MGQCKRLAHLARLRHSRTDDLADDDVMIPTNIDDAHEATLQISSRPLQDRASRLWCWREAGLFHLVRVLGPPLGEGFDQLLILLPEDIQGKNPTLFDQSMGVAGLLEAQRQLPWFKRNLGDPVRNHRVVVIVSFRGDAVKAIGHHPQGVFYRIFTHVLCPWVI